ncbi:TetR family transcriptional regulator [Xylophilus ampelinus]|uniref:TetR family transcriptional regulator n=1 Tax=Xylophilus ampelinus TaxID=54067 RepID=A0A318SFU0_9BURK|nr:TetR family transcriptional regulator [Xylophilus ampelinus]MCS4511427.1 TetR family transcriptional regulator [Xylophilus ampelinus]PYE75830.1 TetR family transcriptional regulator [Xylophilus ampelinus]
MARRTKEDALATRSQLLDAAERLFHDQGVSRTALNDIAVAAGTTRGAIYWHFKDKADLFNAMMERVTLPLENAIDRVGADPQDDPIQQIRDALQHALRVMTYDAQVRTVFEIAIHKVEYVGELRAVRDRHLAVRTECLARMVDGLRLAFARAGRTPPITCEMAAHGLHAMVDGLIQNWLLRPDEFDLQAAGAAVFDIYLAGMGLGPAVAAAVPAEGPAPI